MRKDKFPIFSHLVLMAAFFCGFCGVAPSAIADAKGDGDFVPLKAGADYIASGWIRSEGGTAWIEVALKDPQGKRQRVLKSAKIKGGSDEQFVAIDFSVPTPAQAQIRLTGDGKNMKMRDADIAPAPSIDPMNADFQMPLDKKGRVPFWNQEEDNAMFPGKRGGKFASVAEQGASGAACLALTVSGDWFAFSSLNYGVWPWTKEVTVRARTRVGKDAQVRLGVVWTDSAQKVLRTDIGNVLQESNWRESTAGPFKKPEGASGIRALMLLTKSKAAPETEATACFDDISLAKQDRSWLQVVANQVGFESNGPKTAVVLSNYFPKKKFAGVLDVIDEGGQVVSQADLKCTGRMHGEKNADWGWYFWKGDFSSLKTNGKCKLRARMGNESKDSHPFIVGPDVLLKETANLDVDFFYVQRCGCEVLGWHGPCHLDDARLPDGTHRDLTGGWHSAGDYNKLNWEYGDGGVFYALINAYESAPQFFDSRDRDKKGLCDILDEAVWGAQFVAKVQIPESGGILNNIEQGPDRKTWMNWCPPEKTTDNVVGTPDDPVVTKGEGKSPLAIGGWARLARILEKDGVKNNYLECARRLWDYATAKGTGGTDPLLLISSVDLFLVTREENYLQYAKAGVEGLLKTGQPDGQLPGGYANSGDIPAAALAYFALHLPEEPIVPQIKARLDKHTPYFLAEAANPLGLMMQKPGSEGHFFEPSSTLGHNYEICCRAWSALLTYRVTGNKDLLRYGTDQLDFLLGKNPYDLCMMEGVGSVNLPRYHHRYCTIPGHETGAVPGAIPNGFVRDIAGNDRPGVDLSTGGRPYPSYRTNEPWLVHNVFYTLAVTALHEAMQRQN